MSNNIKETNFKTSIKKPKQKAKGFDVILSNVAGIDIGAELIHVAILNSDNEYEVRVFNSMTKDLKEIANWLIQSNVKHAAMEATGVYWIPLFEVLEDRGVKAVLVDPKNAKNVPGRKTDVIDCQWIHRLYSCGLLRAAFRPSKDKEAFRSFMRHRGNLIKARQKAILQMNKALLLMNIKLDVVVSEIASVSGMNIIRAIAKGEQEPKTLAALRHKSCKKSEQTFIDALTGNIQTTHLYVLIQSLETFDFFVQKINECDAKILEELKKWPTIIEDPLLKQKETKHSKYERSRKPDQNEFNFDMVALMHQKTGVDLTAINSLGELTVATIISELGGKEGLNSFFSEKEFCSWLALCPGNNVSGGKSMGGQSRKSKNRIKRALCMAAMSLCNSKCALGAYYRRMASRVSKSKAIKAVAHKLARLIYNLLKHGNAYIDIGQEAYNKQYEKRRIKNLMKNAKELGYELKAI